ncbi:MAG: hypothetical protein NT066_06105 [Candidatus Omnitrophica bacterium]|nr:hypothetical protein [Candidatus Omnitrophota bacterium]
MKKNSTTDILLLLFSIIGVLFAAEVIMRFSWEMGGWKKRPIYRRSFNPYLRYELSPGATSEGVSVNSDGFRGPEYFLQKPPNTFRILMLGDSETLSVSLEPAETLAAQLEGLLNKNSKSLHYEVLNFGVEGYNTLQELEQLKTKGLKYNPDLVILNYVLNDPEPGEYFFNKSFFMRHSALVRYFNYRVKKALIKRERRRLKIHTEVEHFYYLHQPKFFSHVNNAILEMADIAKKKNSRLLVVIFPASSTAVKDFKENYPYRRLHELVKSIKSDNIIFIDLIEEFNRLGRTPQDVSIGYAQEESHKNASALGAAADYIYGILKNNKAIPQ